MRPARYRVEVAELAERRRVVSIAALAAIVTLGCLLGVVGDSGGAWVLAILVSLWMPGVLVLLAMYWHGVIGGMRRAHRYLRDAGRTHGGRGRAPMSVCPPQREGEWIK